MSRVILISTALVLLAAVTGSAGGTGSIHGIVTDNYGTPLVGATVMVVGTSYGAMTDHRGEYLIINLPPGTYALEARMVGMACMTVEGVEVAEGLTTEYSFAPGFELSPPEEPGELPLSYQLRMEDPCCGRIMTVADGEVVDLPLEHTSVRIEVSGMLQRATVQQEYGNPFDHVIEAVYTFPLPQNGAVDRMDMYIGDVLIHGQVYERETAQTMYAEAIDAGHTAGLLEQERPNIFTQTVGNILPGDRIVVEISYVDDLCVRCRQNHTACSTRGNPHRIRHRPVGKGRCRCKGTQSRVNQPRG
jgi:hypothetical protein